MNRVEINREMDVLREERDMYQRKADAAQQCMNYLMVVRSRLNERSVEEMFEVNELAEVEYQSNKEVNTYWVVVN